MVIFSRGPTGPVGRSECNDFFSGVTLLARMAANWTGVLTLALIYIIISAPFTYSVTNRIFGSLGLRTATVAGAPTKVGLVLHAVVFVTAVHLLSRLHK